MRPGKVIVVDDDDGFRASTERFLRSVGYEVETYADARSLVAHGQHDEAACVLLDVRMPGMSGLQAQTELGRQRFRHPVVFVSGQADVATGVQAIKNGAVDFLVKPFEEKQLLDVIERSLDEDARARAARKAQEDALGRLDQLTARERQVCEYLMKGMINKQIAWELGIAESTVKVHRSRMMEKLGVDSVVALMRLLDQASAVAASGTLHGPADSP